MNRDESLVDVSGRPIKSGDTGIVDVTGRLVATPAGDDEAGRGLPALPGVEKGKIGVRGLIVCLKCSDGNFRQVILEDRQAKKVFKLIMQQQQGTVHMQMEPVFLIVRQLGTAKATAGKPAFWRRVIDWLKK